MLISSFSLIQITLCVRGLSKHSESDAGGKGVARNGQPGVRLEGRASRIC